MLLVVQLIQIARAQTTYESMHGDHSHQHFNESKVAAVVASTIAAGSTSMDGAQINSSDRGPASATGHHHGHSHAHGGRHNDTCFNKVKKALGVGAFVNITKDASRSGGAARRRRGNPFSRGVITNCKDFWCDPTPLLKPNRKKGGEALLGGGPVDYFKMYETPPRMRVSGGSGSGGRYQRLAAEEEDI